MRQNIIFNSLLKQIPVSEITILAGTSPDGLILKTVNGGTSFTNEGSAGKGNLLAFCQLSNGDILYTTDEGYVVNHTQGTSVKVSDYAINAIYRNPINSWLLAGDINGQLFQKEPDTSWGLWDTIIDNPQVNIIISNYIFTSAGIFTWDSRDLLQSGNFTCAYYDEANGFIYAGTNDGHIWRNHTTEDFDIWDDLGKKITEDGGAFIIKIIKVNDDFYYVDDYTNIYKTIDNFSSYDYNAIGMYPFDLAYINFYFYIAGQDNGEGHIYRTNIWNDWNDSDLGQQFSQISINCLISINV